MWASVTCSEGSAAAPGFTRATRANGTTAVVMGRLGYVQATEHATLCLASPKRADPLLPLQETAQYTQTGKHTDTTIVSATGGGLEQIAQ